MFKPKTFQELCFAMQTSAIVEIFRQTGMIRGIRMEDGSGRNFIVELLSNTTADNTINFIFFRE